MSDYNEILHKLELLIKAAEHQHDSHPPHSTPTKHRSLRHHEELFDLHRDHIPHLHDEDKALVNFVKQRLATNNHNKAYWKQQGKKLLKEMKSWHDLMEPTASHQLHLGMRNFCKETGFDLPDLHTHLKQARQMYKAKNRKMTRQHIQLALNTFNKFMEEHFQ